MKRKALHPLALPTSWSHAEFAALWADANHDRAGEDSFEVDDERAEVAVIVNGMVNGLKGD